MTLTQAFWALVIAVVPVVVGVYLRHYLKTKEGGERGRRQPTDGPAAVPPSRVPLAFPDEQNAPTESRQPARSPLAEQTEQPTRRPGPRTPHHRSGSPQRQSDWSGQRLTLGPSTWVTTLACQARRLMHALSPNWIGRATKVERGPFTGEIHDHSVKI